MSHLLIQTPINDPTIGRPVYLTFLFGMAINLVSIYIGNPYIVSLLVLLVSAVMTFKWLNKPMPWLVLVSVVAANPVNLNAPIALNLLFAIALLILNMHHMNKLPSWLYMVLLFVGLSICGSVFNWSTTGGYFTQFAAIGNYVIAPFFLIPLTYYRLQYEVDAGLLLKVFVVSLIVPSITLMLLARTFGVPLIDASSSGVDFLLNVSVYYLGGTTFQLTRTQVGIPLAVLICACASVLLCPVSKYVRSVAAGCLFVAGFLLLVTGSMGSSLSAVCSFGLILIVGRRYISIKRYVVVFPIMIGLVLVGWNFVPAEIKLYAESRYDQKFTGNTIDTSDRSDRWLLSLDYLAANPEGRGWDLYVAPIRTYPHNDYLSYGIAFGLVCGLMYVFVPIKILSLLILQKLPIKNPSQIALLLAGVGVVAVLLFNSLTDHLTANRWYFNVVWSMVWYCYFASKSVTIHEASISLQQGHIV
jgi:hypothetical protein